VDIFSHHAHLRGLSIVFMCLSLCTPIYVCLLTYNSGTGGVFVSKSSSGVLQPPGMLLGQWRSMENWHFLFLVGPAGHVPLQAD